MTPSLATEVRLLEEAYAKLHKMHEDLLKVLTKPGNRRDMRRHPDPCLGVIFGIVDKSAVDFGSLPIHCRPPRTAPPSAR